LTQEVKLKYQVEI